MLEPPFCEREIAEYLRIDICEVSPDDIAEYHQLNPESVSVESFIDESCTFMETKDDGSKIIYTPSSVSPARKRMNIFHECGHASVPWHSEFCYICKNKDIDPGVRKKIEQEAFKCASEFMMPRAHFIGDVLSLQSMSIASIKILSKRYHASLEATANWFAHTHPGICSVVFIEPTEPDNPEYTEHVVIPDNQEHLKIGVPRMVYRTDEPEGVPLKVKYAIRSRRFPDFIRPKTGIDKSSILYDAWFKKKAIQGEIPATVFGFLEKPPYQFECLPLGYRDKMMVLLWEKDPQNRLIYSGKELVV